MSEALLVTPLAVPLVAAIAGLASLRWDRLQRAIGLAGAFGQLGAAVVLVVLVEREGITVLQVGAWPAPFGITLVADRLAVLMVTFGAILGAACTWYAVATVPAERTARGYFVLTNLLLLGIGGSFLTGDLFNLFVWFEVMLIASFVLMALGGTRDQLEGAIKYVTLNLSASAMFLASVGLLYPLAGTFNMADLSLRLAEVEPQGLVTAVTMLLLVAFGIKAAVFPLFTWLPASYHTPPADVSVFFSGLLTKVGVYAIIRTLTITIPESARPADELILLVAGVTMVVGVLGAVVQTDFRRLLSFHIVSQIGYMVMGLGLATPLGLAGAIFYMTQHMVTKTALFMVAGLVERDRGTGWLDYLGGLYRGRPELAAIFGLAALSLAGIPPLAGFVAKLTLTRAGLEIDSIAIVVVALAVSLLTLYSMSKVWLAAFLRPGTSELGARGYGYAAVVPAAVLTAASIGIGLFGGPYLDFVLQTAEELLDSEAYVSAVLGEAP